MEPWLRLAREIAFGYEADNLRIDHDSWHRPGGILEQTVMFSQWRNAHQQPSAEGRTSLEAKSANRGQSAHMRVPRAVPTGTDSYYVDRLADFLDRCPDHPAPSYYLEYGDKCLHRFRRIEIELTSTGKEWSQRTLRSLQEMIESERERDSEAFVRLEMDSNAFRDFAFNTHPTAYIESGLFLLSVQDIRTIFQTPEASDVFTVDGLKQICKVARQLKVKDVLDIATATLEQWRPTRRQRVRKFFIRLFHAD